MLPPTSNLSKVLHIPPSSRSEINPPYQLYDCSYPKPLSSYWLKISYLRLITLKIATPTAIFLISLTLIIFFPFYFLSFNIIGHCLTYYINYISFIYYINNTIYKNIIYSCLFLPTKKVSFTDQKSCLVLFDSLIYPKCQEQWLVHSRYSINQFLRVFHKWFEAKEVHYIHYIFWNIIWKTHNPVSKN